MCNGSKQKPFEIGFIIGIEFDKQDSNIIPILLELSSFDDLIGFKISMEEECHDIDEASLWYGRRIGSKMMGFEEKTTLMIATMFGSKGVLNYILETSCVDVNQTCGLDGLLHLILFLLWTLLFQLRLTQTCDSSLHLHMHTGRTSVFQPIKQTKEKTLCNSENLCSCSAIQKTENFYSSSATTDELEAIPSLLFNNRQFRRTFANVSISASVSVSRVCVCVMICAVSEFWNLSLD
ncbi:zinc finger ccch domain-containing protein 66 [Quercus suber]|uniref:Zinc finger ccch domain-containing protein 66 n=1 Tax=Quercus suber TaxID=58331 RepID=A0AAW0KPU0_QUESU